MHDDNDSPPFVSTCSKCKQTELGLPDVRKSVAVACISAGHSLSLSVDLLASRSSSVCRSPVPHEQQSSGAGSSDRGPTRSWLFSEHPSITERADQIEPGRVGGMDREEHLAIFGIRKLLPTSDKVMLMMSP